MSDQRKTQWYSEVFLAIGGWIAAIFAAIAIFALAAAMVAGMGKGADVTAALVALSVGVCFAGFGAAIGGREAGPFRRHFSLAIAMAGLTAATAGLWYLFANASGPHDFGSRNVGISGLFVALILAIVCWAVSRRLQDGIFSFLSASAVYGVALLSLIIVTKSPFHPATSIFAAVTAAAGALLFVQRRTLFVTRPAAAAMMIAPLQRLSDLQTVGGLFGDGAQKIHALALYPFEKLIVFAAAAFCLFLLRRRYSPAPFLTAALIVAAATALLPTAGAIAILILLAGITANHRALTIVGIIASAWFISTYYYNHLAASLLMKAAILAALGSATLAGALFFRRAGRLAEAGVSPSTGRRNALSIIAFGAILAASAAMTDRNVLSLDSISANARDVYFPLGPRDPRSLIQGDYMRLRYRETIFPPPAEIADAPPRGSVFLKLDEKGVAAFSRWASDGAAPQADEVRIDYSKTGDSALRYVADTYFFAEGDTDKYAAARFAIVAVAPDGRARLTGLADGDLKRLGR